MTGYAEVLEQEDPRIARIFDVEAETHHSGSIVIDDPFPRMQELMAQAPVHKGALGSLLGYGPEAGFNFHIEGQETYTALSFKAVSRTLIENDVFSSEVYHRFEVNEYLFKNGILHLSGAEHRRMRGPIQPFFSPAEAQTWWNRKAIEETVDILMSKIERKQSADIFLELLARMPVHVVTASFGIDPDEVVSFRMALLGVDDDGVTSERDRGNGEQRSRAILQRYITARRKDPQDDIISKIVHADVPTAEGGTRRFTDDEVIENCRLIVLAGGGTTWRQGGITLFALLNNPEQFEALKADRSLLPNVILESARWHPTDLIFPRVATRDVELEGVEIPKGALVHMCLGAANRDPSRWDNPEKFDIFRPVQRSLAFGGGPHSCLGQHVARQEIVVAFNAIMDRLPNLKWDSSKPPARLTGGLFARGPSALPVTWG